MPTSRHFIALCIGVCIGVSAGSVAAFIHPGQRGDGGLERRLNELAGAFFAGPAVSQSAASELPIVQQPPPAALPTAKYARITGGMVRVLERIDPASPVLGLARKDSYFPLIAVYESWCKIDFKGKPGWVERRNVQLTDEISSPFFKQLVVAMSVMTAAALILIGIIIVRNRFDRLRGEWIESVHIQKNVLIVAGVDKQIRRYLSDTVISLEKCFSEIGFQIHRARDVSAPIKMLMHLLPDIMVVDWSLDPGIHGVIARLLSSQATAGNIFTIFYNVPDAAEAQRRSSISNAQYLGHTFTDRELFSLITPLLITGEQPKSLRTSVESSALEGAIAGGSLLEVFQFVEIGRKSGCLLIEDKRPVGMVFFNQGIIVYAATRRSTGRQAIFDILGQNAGRFRFILDKEAKAVNCNIPTLAVLMEWSKEIDEAHGR